MPSTRSKAATSLRSYITAEDVGTTPQDLVTIRERTPHLTGLPAEHGGSGDPSPFTAMGVEAAMRACARERFGSPDLAGLRVVIVGMGSVGAKLARRLADAGAQLLVSDIDPAKRAVAAALGALWLPPGEEISADCEILAPCALGGTIDAASLPLLRCQIVCGCANNQLSEERHAEALAERGILYAPDFIANAGGLISVYREIRGYSEERARELAMGIEQNLGRVFDGARALRATPLRAAHALARERLRYAARAA
jgi:leucine dehydrogenase